MYVCNKIKTDTVDAIMLFCYILKSIRIDSTIKFSKSFALRKRLFHMFFIVDIIDRNTRTLHHNIHTKRNLGSNIITSELSV
jgi:hypothetical protein